MSTESAEQGHGGLGRQGRGVGCRSLQARRAAMDTDTGTDTSMAHSTHSTHTNAPASPALGRAQGLGMGTRTRMGAGAPVGRGSGRGVTRVWLAESMVASVLSPCRGTSGIVPNFCLARSEEERRRRTTGRRSSCCAQGQGGEGGHALPALPSPAQLGGTTSLHPPEP